MCYRTMMSQEWRTDSTLPSLHSNRLKRTSSNVRTSNVNPITQTQPIQGNYYVEDEPMDVDYRESEKTGKLGEKVTGKSILKSSQRTRPKLQRKVTIRDPYHEPDQYQRNLIQEREKRRRIRRERERNKQIRLIYHEENLPYLNDTTGEEHEQFFREATNFRIRNIKRIIERKNCVRDARNVDLCFLVDVGRYNQAYVNGVRDYINRFTGKLRTGRASGEKSYSEGADLLKKLRICFVGYRDLHDQERFIVYPFGNFQNKRNRLPNIEAFGGSLTNDVFGGLDNALRQSWSADSGTKIIFHVANGPCHGREFYDYFLHDKYPRGDPNGLTHTDLFRRMREKDIDYYCGVVKKNAKYTARMIAKFSEAYREQVTEYHLSDPDGITKSVYDAVIKSVEKSASSCCPIASCGGKSPRDFRIIQNRPHWPNILSKKAKQINYELPDSIDDLINCVPLARKTPTQISLKIATNPFSKGSDTLVYLGTDGSSEVVGKESLYVGIDRNSALKYEVTSQIRAIATFLLHEFQDELREEGGKFSFKVAKVKTLCIPSDDESEKYRFMNLEKYLPDYERIVRFTDNTDFVTDESEVEKFGMKSNIVRVLTAFSHWTYQKTLKNFMVVSLKGLVHVDQYRQTEILLVHPAIHCSDVIRFNQKNLGKDGMDSFFSSHVCNEYCRMLDLRPVVAEPTRF